MIFLFFLLYVFIPCIAAEKGENNKSEHPSPIPKSISMQQLIPKEVEEGKSLFKTASERFFNSDRTRALNKAHSEPNSPKTPSPQPFPKKKFGTLKRKKLEILRPETECNQSKTSSIDNKRQNDLIKKYSNELLKLTSTLFLANIIEDIKNYKNSSYSSEAKEKLLNKINAQKTLFYNAENKVKITIDDFTDRKLTFTTLMDVLGLINLDSIPSKDKNEWIEITEQFYKSLNIEFLPLSERQTSRKSVKEISTSTALSQKNEIMFFTEIESSKDKIVEMLVRRNNMFINK